MKRPQLLEEKDKYILLSDDFTSLFERYIFAAIYNLHKDGSQAISVVDVDTYFEAHPVAKEIFLHNGGIEYLQNALDFAQEDNFPYYYKRLKKFNALRDLQKLGYNTSQIYEPDILNPNSQKINEKFEELEIQDIFDLIKKQFIKIETDYSVGDASETLSAHEGILDLVQELEIRPEVGAPLQGEIFNTVTRGARKSKFYIRSSSSGIGKALPNSTLIPTPSGWKEVGSVKVGDYLFDAFGKPTQVLGVYPQGKKEVFELTFEDGRTAKSSKDHLWSYNTCGQGKKSKEQRIFYTHTLEEISRKELQGSGGEYRVLMPMNYAVEYERKDFHIPPYIFGLALGRQHHSNKSFQYSSEDSELPQIIADTMGWKLKRGSLKNHTWYFENRNSTSKIANIWVEDFLVEYPELINLRSKDKYIPAKYLAGSIDQRFDLLNGLLDSDGSVEKGRIQFFTISEKMKNNVVELAQSLGFKTTVSEDIHKDTNLCYVVYITGRPEDKNKLFRLKRKKERLKGWFDSKKRKESNEHNPLIKIENLGYEEEMTCFRVNNSEHLFLTENFVVTHNTRAAVGDACFLSYPLRFNSCEWKWEQNGCNEKTLFIATEQETDEIQTLILAYLTGFNEEKILYSQYTDSEKKVLEEALKIIEYYKDNLLIVRLPNPNIEQLRAIVRQNWILYEIDNVFFDYIFSSPSLLNEFRDLRVRTDEALMMLSTALKDLAVEMNLFIMSSTQVNAKIEEKGREINNEGVIRGSRAIVDKADIACVMNRVGSRDKEIIEPIIQEYSVEPNIVVDVYKVRRGKYSNVKIWSEFDLGTCRKKDLFITDQFYNAIPGFQVHDYIIRQPDLETELEKVFKILEEKESNKLEEENINLEELEEKEFEKSLFGAYL